MDWTLELVPIPVADMDRAVRFYAEQVGLAVDHDTRVDDATRIVQLTPPGSGCSIAVGTGSSTRPPGAVQGSQLVVSDVESAREHLLAPAVEVGPVFHYEGARRVEGPGGRWNALVAFSDPEGNGWVVQERPAGG